MSTKIIVLAILYFLVVRYMQNRENYKGVDDIYNVKRKGNKGNSSENTTGTNYNKSISGSNNAGSSGSNTAGPTGPLSRGGF